MEKKKLHSTICQYPVKKESISLYKWPVPRGKKENKSFYLLLIHYFLLSINRESIILGSIWVVIVEILMNFHILRSLESENQNFSSWSVYVSFISITQKHMTAESSSLPFYISIICRCYFKLFVKIKQKLCTEATQ